jgi:serine/threonine-protein kinase
MSASPTPAGTPPPTTIGPYPIERELGRGGMGVVYLGRDPRLNRAVAIKVLPEDVARDPSRLSRFEREARTLAALNHRNVGLIYGLEESEGRRLLVLEFVPGATLTQRLARGAMALDEAARVCAQIAEGLEAAHERDVVHRDLKPDNIKIAPDGTVKILDFGLATTRHADDGTGPGGYTSDDATTVITPAFTSTLTQHGMIMGTPGYMSPEQARGLPIDKRTDIWAFGCVLFECLCGLRAFGGPTPSDMLAAVIDREPDWAALPGRTPARVRDLLRRCLVKDARRRLRDVGDARLELEDLLDGSPAGATAWGGGGPEHSRTVARLAMSLPASAVPGGLTQGARPSLAVSADGAQVAFVAGRPPETRIFIRRLDEPEPRPVPGTEGGESPFFSPDGARLGFFEGGRLKVLTIAGGAPLPLAAAPRPQGGTWGTDDSIFFIPDWQRGLCRVPAGGGPVEPIAEPDAASGELAFSGPDALPAGNAVLVAAWTGTGHDGSLIVAIDTRTGQRRPLMSGGSNPRYAASGHLLFTRAGSLLAVPFNPERLEVTGGPAIVEDRILSNALTGAAQFALGGEASGGMLITAPGGLWEPRRTLMTADRQAQAAAQALVAEARAYTAPALSHDSARLAAQVQGATDHLWLIDLSRHAATRLTFRGDNGSPVWSPDGARIAFRSNISGRYELYWMAADGAGTPVLLVGGEGAPVPEAFTPDGRSLLYSRARADGTRGGTEIWSVPVDDPAAARPLVQTQRSAWGASVSPDGRTVAFASDEGGRTDVYAQPMPAGAAGPSDPAGRRPITADTPGGGAAPLWLRTGGELMYRAGDTLTAVRIAFEPAFMVGRARPALQGRFLPPTHLSRNYDVFPNGQRLLVLRAEEEESSVHSLNVVMNWHDELRRRVPLPAPTALTRGSRAGSSHTPGFVRRPPGPPPDIHDSKTIG